ncbi:MAG: DUF2064 domain-containing protein [Wenzhouxiangellaceae bacterium]|nr:DUF2064 domain-containing protein [Wenzhouxiangellaceae bacterium]
MNRPAVAIFVKTPGLSPVKTRLAKRLGDDAAADWHRRAAACVAEVVANSGLPACWAIAEPEAEDHPLWQGLPRVAQGDGGLGERMARVHSALVARHGAAILVGADLPQLRAADLREAADWLAGSAPCQVLGPARDGGFWLFGSNREHPLEAWTRPRYSRPDTAARFRESVSSVAGEQWLVLPERTDLDRAEDIDPVLAEIDALDEASPRQRDLADWLRRQRVTP